MNLLEMVKEAGVIGAGGAGFPTHVKLATQAEYILLNGAECEPLLRVDQQLMALYPDEIIKGFEAAGKLVGASHALIGIKGKHREVISLLKNRIVDLHLNHFIEVRELKDIYPAGDEQVLVHELTGRIVPEAGLPIHVGCVVINSETALNIYYASKNQPVIDTYITVSGDIPNRFTMRVPVGTPIVEVLKHSGIEDLQDYAVIDGGPMMGSVLKSIDGYVTKKTKGFIVLKKQHFLIKRKTINLDQARRVNRTTCEQCRLCTDLCPRYLLGHNMQPHKIMRVTNYSLDHIEDQKIAYLCCHCNLCELFSCPIGLHPQLANLYSKQQLAQQNIRYKTEQTEFQARKSREYRLIPSERLIARLGLRDLNLPAPMTDSVAITPDIVFIARSQHVGAPAVPIVSVGDHVGSGQKLGDIPEGGLGAPIHASISGIVVEINQDYIAVRRTADA